MDALWLKIIANLIKIILITTLGLKTVLDGCTLSNLQFCEKPFHKFLSFQS